MNRQICRRTFLAAACVSSVAASARGGPAAASERVRIAVIGLRSRGTDLSRLFAANPGTVVGAVCDVDNAMFEKPVSAVEKIAGKAPRTEKDFRQLLDDKTIDAVAIATPDHWHASESTSATASPGRYLRASITPCGRGPHPIGRTTPTALLRTGKKLAFDAATESFKDAEANALLAREYSRRFEMPSHV